MASEVQNIEASQELNDQAPELVNKEEEEEHAISHEIQDPVGDTEHDEAKVFLDLFNNLDKEKTGSIKAENLYEIAIMLGKNSENVDGVLKNQNKTKEDQITLEEYQQIIAELDRPNTSIIQSEVSHHSQHSQQSQRVVITPDPKVIEFLRLLHAFQGKCEVEGKYGEAKLAQEKMEEIRIKEIQTQENNIRAFQEEELTQVENAQKEQFIEFNKVWDRYMIDYEATALESLEKLKEKHIKEVEELHERLKTELAFHFKSSKQLLELRQKEAALVKMKKYSEAERIKMQADALEEFERNNKEKEIGEIMDKKTAALRTQQQRSLSVLLKRIQKDRDQQIKNREIDSQKLILKNRNLRNELLSKHTLEAKNAIEVVRNNLSISNLPKSGQSPLGKKDMTLNSSRKSSVKSSVKNDSPTSVPDDEKKA